MRKKIDKYHLETAVNLICRLKDNFSYYDITQAVRKTLPEYDILHEDVKSIVKDHVSHNIYIVSNNGFYNIFTKPTPMVPVVKPQSKLEKLLEEKKQPKQSVNPVVVKRPQVFTEAVIKQQLENRINITNFVRKIFGNDKVVIEKTPAQIKIYPAKNNVRSTNNTILTSAYSEIRLRTGFKTSYVLVKTYKDSIEITPKV